MCGFCGVVNAGRLHDAPARVAAMTDMQARRGPDDEGHWSSADGQAHLGFRRLSVIDTSSHGHQPMATPDGQAVLVFNGEIYNHGELRDELGADGVTFHSRSDTEVLLHWLARHGVAGLGRLNGMFALAYYQPAARTLLLARDHVGIKPLSYVTEPGGPGVAFSSRYDALLRTGWLDPDAVRPDVVDLYLELRHIPAPYAMHERAAQVLPGGYVEIDERGVRRTGLWWTAPEDVVPDLHGAAAREATGAALDAAVRRQRIADVPLGVFLSGGVDSPLVAGTARRQVDQPIDAFTVGAEGWAQDESADAARFAEQLDLRHHLLHATDDEVHAAVDAVAEAQYEPFADRSILPTLLVSGLARQEVTVALSGDGGDELFFGYERPRSLLRGWETWERPYLLRRAVVAAGSRGLWPGKVPGKAQAERTPGGYYRGVHSTVGGPLRAELAPGLPGPPSDFALYDLDRPYTYDRLATFSRRVELSGQLQGVLKKVDMASMHHSLEVRVPILDREVVDVAFRIDVGTHLAGDRRKAVLFDLLGGLVPPGTIPTAKRGFASPIADWLRGPLAERVHDTLVGHDAYPAGTFDAATRRRLWEEHRDGRATHTQVLWTMLCLQWWGERARTLT